jgi:hypothetical protein
LPPRWVSASQFLELEVGKVPQNYWGVICNEPNAPGVWKKWLGENCVAIGWPPPTYTLEGPTNTPGWDSARAFAQQVSPATL